MPCLSHIFIYPIKSLDGVAVSQATLLESGAIAGDREFAIIDDRGQYVNGKRHAAIHRLRSRFDLSQRLVTLQGQGQSEVTFDLDADRRDLALWLSDYFGFAVQLQQNQQVGFPDDLDSPGPTLISSETLQTVASWFPDLTLEEVRRRFRTNLEIAAEVPFWEERLFSADDRPQPFQIGPVQLAGINPCQRCVVPLRDSQTGAAYSGFQAKFTAARQATLPEWAPRSRFNHFYKLAVNTRLVPGSSRQLQVGDAVRGL